MIPTGQHEIKFVFNPGSFYTGETLATIACALILLTLAIAAFSQYRNSRLKVAP
jgi:hypothetical protein